MILKMKKIVKIFVIVLTICAVLIFLGSGLYAYFTYQASVKDIVTLGYNEIAINENYEPPVTMQKGIEYTKEPYVTNVGNIDCYVRIKPVLSDSRLQNDITLNYNSSGDFVYNNQDGYYYYYKALKPGESTSMLFTKVQISQDVDETLLEGFDIYIFAESIQTVDGKEMSEVWNTFSE